MNTFFFLSTMDTVHKKKLQNSVNLLLINCPLNQLLSEKEKTLLQRKRAQRPRPTFFFQTLSVGYC